MTHTGRYQFVDENPETGTVEQRAREAFQANRQNEATQANCDAGSTAGNEIGGATAKAPLQTVHFKPTFYTRVVKPLGDRVAAIIALCLLAIPMAIVGAIVAMSMGTPVLFKQRRIGLNGKPFDVLKFRTMDSDRRGLELDVIRDRRITHKSGSDPRHTTVGQFLRRYSLDELPQLINIARGDMSVIGPRPELESVVATKYPAGLEQRHLVRPGLTGLWQISARGEGPMHENGEWDLAYVEQVSLYTDLKIVLKTPFAMFGRNTGE